MSLVSKISYLAIVCAFGMSGFSSADQFGSAPGFFNNPDCRNHLAGLRNADSRRGQEIALQVANHGHPPKESQELAERLYRLEYLLQNYDRAALDVMKLRQILKRYEAKLKEQAGTDRQVLWDESLKEAAAYLMQVDLAVVDSSAIYALILFGQPDLTEAPKSYDHAIMMLGVEYDLYDLSHYHLLVSREMATMPLTMKIADAPEGLRDELERFGYDRWRIHAEIEEPRRLDVDEQLHFLIVAKDYATDETLPLRYRVALEAHIDFIVKYQFHVDEPLIRLVESIRAYKRLKSEAPN